MSAIVPPGADDFVRVGDRRQQDDLRERYVRGRDRYFISGSGKRAAGNSRAQSGISIAEPASQIDNAVADDCAIRVASGCRKADKFHGVSSLGEISSAQIATDGHREHGKRRQSASSGFRLPLSLSERCRSSPLGRWPVIAEARNSQAGNAAPVKCRFPKIQLLFGKQIALTCFLACEDAGAYRHDDGRLSAT